MKQIGEAHLKPQDALDIREDPDSHIVFLEDELDVAIISVVRQIPLVAGGMGGIVGFNYEALKDYCKWYRLKPLSKSVPLLSRILNVKIGEINSKNK